MTTGIRPYARCQCRPVTCGFFQADCFGMGLLSYCTMDTGQQADATHPRRLAIVHCEARRLMRRLAPPREARDCDLVHSLQYSVHSST